MARVSETTDSKDNISKTRFYELIDEGRIPQGKKRIGSKEKWWYKDEIEKCKNKR